MSVNPKKESHHKYRPDIDGLRALAVISVVIFHAFPEYLRGGFIGVDVFFVISGYLISGIILKNLENNSFSLVSFYSRRIKRIFPALLLVMVAVYMFGRIALLEKEYQQLGFHIFSSAGFLQNIVLWHESGYFDNSSDTKPMLHLWSLGIEEQFYIVWPLILWIVFRARVSKSGILSALFLSSFVWNIYIIKGDASQAFFSPVTRFWELAAGGILSYLVIYKDKTVAFMKNKFGFVLSKMTYGGMEINKSNSVISFVGAFALFSGIILINEESQFPGYWALLPVFGSFLIIFAGQDAWFNRIVLSNRVFVWIGLISYPLYLWHWPLLSFARILEGPDYSYFLRMFLVIISLLLAVITYFLVEKPLRFGKFSKIKTIGLTLLMVYVGYTGLKLFVKLGHPDREVVNEYKMYYQSLGWSSYDDKGYAVQGCGIVDKEDEKKIPFCRKDKRGKAVFALIGDSKASSLYSALYRNSDSNSRWIFIGGTDPKNGAVVPMITDEPGYLFYKEFTGIAAKAVIENPEIKIVVLTTAARVLFGLKSVSSLEEMPASLNYRIAFDGLDRMVEKIANAGKKVVITVDNPAFPDPKDCISRKTSSSVVNYVLNQFKNNVECSIDYRKHRELSKQYLNLLENLQKKHGKNLKIFDPTKLLCDMKNMTCSVVMNDKLLYSVTDHISDYSADNIAKKLIPFLVDYEKIPEGIYVAE